jgi:hypothetical protein
MSGYAFVFPTGFPATINEAQREALVRVAQRWNLTNTVEVQPMFGGGGAVVVNVGSMWLAVEPDGYTHS